MKNSENISHIALTPYDNNYLNLQYDPNNKMRKSNNSLTVVVIIQVVVKKKNKTVLFVFTTYII